MIVSVDLAAGMYLDQLAQSDKLALARALDRIRNANGLQQIGMHIEPVRIGPEEETYSLSVDPDWRIIFRRKQNQIEVLEIVAESQIAALRRSRQ
jgi:plasmid maintenance system killer protein